MAYGYFAEVYDKLMSDFDYSEYADKILSLFEKYSKRPALLLDLACGTGEMAAKMVDSGIDTVAVDISEEMLYIAKQKRPQLLCLCQSADQLDLYGTVDGAVCTLDSINHITDVGQLRQAFERVSLFLEKDCLFIFDVNTEYKHREILSDNTFVMDTQEVYCVWQNETEDNLTDITLDFFVKSGNAYQRHTEEFSERAYPEGELEGLVASSGLDVVEKFDFDTMGVPGATTERILYVTRKK